VRRVARWAGQAAELASEAARAEGASPPPPPTVAGAARIPGQAVKHEWLPRRTCPAAGSRTFALDRRASRPARTTSLPASLVASKPGGDIPRL
jgi:hypothetical protein